MYCPASPALYVDACGNRRAKFAFKNLVCKLHDKLHEFVTETKRVLRFLQPPFPLSPTLRNGHDMNPLDLLSS